MSACRRGSGSNHRVTENTEKIQFNFFSVFSVFSVTLWLEPANCGAFEAGAV